MLHGTCITLLGKTDDQLLRTLTCAPAMGEDSPVRVVLRSSRRLLLHKWESKRQFDGARKSKRSRAGIPDSWLAAFYVLSKMSAVLCSDSSCNCGGIAKNNGLGEGRAKALGPGCGLTSFVGTRTHYRTLGSRCSNLTQRYMYAHKTFGATTPPYWFACSGERALTGSLGSKTSRHGGSNARD